VKLVCRFSAARPSFTAMATRSKPGRRGAHEKAFVEVFVLGHNWTTRRRRP
jgi:hypothetical protein